MRDGDGGGPCCIAWRLPRSPGKEGGVSRGNDFTEDYQDTSLEPWAASFRNALRLRGHPDSRLKWYFMWAERCAACLSDRSLTSTQDAEGFLTTLASSPGVTPWQVEQATDALTILPGNASGQETDGGEPAALNGRSYQCNGRSVAGQTRSRIIAIPWPTPMHMVQRA